MSVDAEFWIAELLANGWTRKDSTTWKSPSGHWFRGPYGAWCEMYKDPELSIPKSRQQEEK